MSTFWVTYHKPHRRNFAGDQREVTDDEYEEVKDFVNKQASTVTSAPEKPPADKAVSASPKGQPSTRDKLKNLVEKTEDKGGKARIKSADGVSELKEIADDLELTDEVDLRYGEKKLRKAMLEALASK